MNRCIGLQLCFSLDRHVQKKSRNKKGLNFSVQLKYFANYAPHFLGNSFVCKIEFSAIRYPLLFAAEYFRGHTCSTMHNTVANQEKYSKLLFCGGPEERISATKMHKSLSNQYVLCSNDSACYCLYYNSPIHVCYRVFGESPPPFAPKPPVQ